MQLPKRGHLGGILGSFVLENSSENTEIIYSIKLKF